MGRIRENINRRNQIISSIRMILENQGIDSGTDWDKDTQNLRNLNLLTDNNQEYIIGSNVLGITQEDDENKLIFVSMKDDIAILQEKLLNEAVQVFLEPSTKSVQLIFFVHDMKKRIELENLYSANALKMMKKQIKIEASKRGPENPNLKNRKFTLFSNFVLIHEHSKRDIWLTDLHCLDMFQEPPLDRNITRDTTFKARDEIQAQVFTVDLFQLVQRYNLIGDMLFQNNVRFGIRETLGVEQSIRQTLQKEPQHFWFKNNGVTILIRNSPTSVRGAKSVFLGKIDPIMQPDFSVVNGAQTITTAARYFFGLEYQIDHCKPPEKSHYEDELKRAKTLARVLVRVINITSEDVERAEQLARDISVALNRQKPIRTDDIAFTAPSVQKLIDCLRNSQDPPFMLVRQGEMANFYKSMELTPFARARLACANRPGVARSSSRNKLLETRSDEDGNVVFSYQELFSSDWVEEKESEDMNAIINRDYRAIWFAHRLATAYEDAMRKFSSDDREILNTIKNGKWYFTAVVTQIYNGFQTTLVNNKYLPDYSGFSANIPANLTELMGDFAELVVTIAKETAAEKEINSNLFKGEELYSNIITAIKAYFTPEASPQLEGKIHEQIKQLISKMELHQVKFDFNDPSANYVVLAGSRVNVETDAKALVTIASYIMNHYPELEKTILDKCRGWLHPSDDGFSQGTGTFTVTVRGKLYYIETHANTPSKCTRMKNLCRAANVSAGEVKWHKTGDATFTFCS